MKHRNKHGKYKVQSEEETLQDETIEHGSSKEIIESIRKVEFFFKHNAIEEYSVIMKLESTVSNILLKKFHQTKITVYFIKDSS